MGEIEFRECRKRQSTLKRTRGGREKKKVGKAGNTKQRFL
jgi:hypothetical protein